MREWRMPYYERKTISGRLMEVERYHATRDGRKIGRSENTEESTDSQKRQNDVQAANRLRRILLANFSPEAGDLFVTLTIAQPVSAKEEDDWWRRFLDRVKKERKAAGLPDVKWVKVKEKQSGRWHFHVVMNAGLSLDKLQELWGRHNRLTMSVLNDGDNYRGLSRYLVEGHKPRRNAGANEGREGTLPQGSGMQAGKSESADAYADVRCNAKEERQKFKRRWSCSRNLAKPKVTKRQISPRTVMQLPKAPKGYRLLPEWTMGTDKFGSPFVRFECVKDDAAGEAVRKTAGSSRERAADKQRGAPRCLSE